MKNSQMNIKIYSLSLPVCVLAVKEVLLRKLNTLRLDLGKNLSFSTDNTNLNIDMGCAAKHIVLCSSRTDVSSIKNAQIIPVIFDKDEELHDSIKHINAFVYNKRRKHKDSSNEQLCNVILEKLGIIRNTKNVFISYKREDTSKLANKIWKRLVIEGYAVFLDKKKIDIGVDFMDRIRYAIADADVFILLDSPGYFSSVYTKKEMYAACLSRVPIIMLTQENAEKAEKYDFVYQYLKSNDTVSDEEFQCLIKRIREIQEQTHIYRLSKIRTKFKGFEGNKEIQLSNLYIPNKGDRKICSIHAIYGIPKTTDLEAIQKDELNPNVKVAAIYDDLCLPKSCYEHVEWLNNEMRGIELVKMSNMQEEIDQKLLGHKKEKNKNSSRPCVFLSASVPNADDGNYDYLKIHDIVVTLTYEVIKRGGTLVFGGHPTITPIIQNVMEIMGYDRQSGIYPDIRLYQSKYFKEEYQLEVKLFLEKFLHETEIRGENVETGENSKMASLKYMRTRMIIDDGIKFTSAVFLGGKYEITPKDSGVWEEYEMFKMHHKNARCLFFEKTGNVPKFLKDEENSECEFDSIEKLPDLL